MLRAGFGWGNMPKHMVQEDLASGQLIQIQPEEWLDDLRVPQYIIHRVADPPGPAGQWVIRQLQRRCAEDDCGMAPQMAGAAAQGS